MWLLPAAFLVHLAGEWWGGEGLQAWSGRLAGRASESERTFWWAIAGGVMAHALAAVAAFR